MAKIIADKKIRQERLSQCLGCPFNKGKTCGACGCVIKAKIAIARSKCPEGKW